MKKYDNVVNGTLSGPSSRVIRGKLLVPVSTFLSVQVSYITNIVLSTCFR